MSTTQPDQDHIRSELTHWLLLFSVAIISLSIACRPNQVVTRIPTDHASLQGLATIYIYAAAELGRPPQSLDDLQPIFAKASIQDPTKMLVSTRDKQPFEIIWDVDVAGRYAGSDVPIAYERTGVEGMRLLITCSMVIKQIDEEEFTNLKWPIGYKPYLEMKSSASNR